MKFFWGTCELVDKKRADLLGTSLRTEKLSTNAFGTKLVASSNTVMPLSLQYDPVEPNSVQNWLNRWSASHFWEPLPLTKKISNTKPKRKQTKLQPGETEPTRPNRSVRRVPAASLEGNLVNTSENEKPKSSFRKVSSHQAESVQEQSSNELKLDASNVIVVGNPTQGMKSKSKLDQIPAKKGAPNSFPSNVRSLMAIGILDGVPVKYVSPSREELRGIIKGSGYLCGCQSCNHSKALNAYEFQRHAGCKKKHPNSRIYFDSGKTIYQIVQELRSTPESLLFDAIQTVTGSLINQKAFRNWKESFQAATRELERIYGKDELNI